MKQYKLINNVMGWVAFLVSAITYILTTEASASFWDCGEFISTADKLLVGHPPGAPLFMIIARMFAIAAPDVTLVAKFINVMSALASAFTILFLFWTITHLARKIMIDGAEKDANGEPEAWRVWAVMGAGMVGALAYTFSDTFWFSAVEGEVYGMSSLFTAAVFWCILKWENVADEPGSNRWLVLIAYLMGLSIGVHLLNLLCIPAIGLIYYFRKYKATAKGVIIALCVSCVILGVILYGIIPGLVKIAGYFDLLFVNGLGLGLNSGAIFWMILVIAGLIAGMIVTYKRRKVVANTILNCAAVIILGYMSFAMVVIRSAADPTMDQNSPDNVFSLIDYLNREQYGDTPLFKGQTFASPQAEPGTYNSEGAPVYKIKDGKYVVAEYKTKYKYQAEVLFPRMYSPQAPHIAQYKAWSGFNGKNGNNVYVERNGQKQVVNIPTFGQNLRFFLSYQINFMYLRYFMWNFSGRQNDIQGNGELTHGNWLTGIPALDNYFYGDQELLPDSLKSNKGHNVYYMLPLILGLAGLFFQAGKDKKNFWVVMLLFFMTGLAIVLYLNQTPLQPRERDYAYAGSFYAFAIWIGLGVLQLIDWLHALKAPRMVATIVASVLSLIFVPGLMAEQNWDDHDRSGCTIARDMAYNYLNSCDDNAVIFTNGDNDTFPLWYAQEVEGCRTDVRVCNLSYLQTEWYCDQMKRKAYESDPLPISFTHDEYTHDRDVVYLIDQDKWKDGLNLRSALDFIHSEDPRTKSLPQYTSERICFVPAKKFVLDVDTAAVIKAGAVNPSKTGDIVKQMRITPGGNYILKNCLMVLDMLATSNWQRPLYYAVTVGRENYYGLDNYFQLEGLAQRIVPIKGGTDRNSGASGTVDTDKMYDNVMNKFRWGSFNAPGLYLDENKSRMASNMRMHLTRLATALLDERDSTADTLVANQKQTRAIEVLDKIQTEIPSWAVPHNFLSVQMATDYYRAGLSANGDSIISEYALDNRQELNYYLSMRESLMVQSVSGIERCMAIYYELLRVCDRDERKDLADKLIDDYAALAEFATSLLGYDE